MGSWLHEQSSRVYSYFQILKWRRHSFILTNRFRRFLMIFLRFCISIGAHVLIYYDDCQHYNFP